jgi:oligosaccharide repeat unit polymerase
MKIAYISIFRPTIPSVLILFIYIYQYIGLPILFYTTFTNTSDILFEIDILFFVFFFTSSSITFLIIGFIIAHKYLGEIKFKNTSSFSPLNKRQKKSLNILAFFSLYILFVYINKIGFQSLALINAIGLYSDVNIDLSRSMMTNSFSGGYHWYKLIITDLFSFIVISYIAHYLISNEKYYLYKIIFYSIILIFSLLLTTEKGPVMIFFISCFFTFNFIKKEGILNGKSVFRLFILIFLIIVLIYTYVLNFSDLSSSVEAIFKRVFTGQIIPAYFYLDYFPSKESFLMGKSFPNPSGVLPFVPFKLTEIISAYYFTSQDGVIGSAPTIFWGELYANFGFLGVLIVPLFIGIFLYALNIYVLKLNINPIVISYYIWLIIHYSYLSGTSLSTYIFDIYLFFITLFFVMLNWRFKFSNYA